MSHPLVLAGSGNFVLPVFSALLRKNLLSAVVVAPDRPKGRGKRNQEELLATEAKKHSLRVFKFDDINHPESLKHLKSLKAHLILTASYGQFLSQNVINLFPKGAWNLHPSLLPAYRGASPVPSALYDGCSETGISLFKMIRKMDAGPLAIQWKTEIFPREDAGELLNRLATLGAAMFLETLPQIIKGNVILNAQDESKASYCFKMNKASGQINWQLPAKTLHNHLRAHSPWPGNYSFLQGRRLNFFDFFFQEYLHEQKPGTLLFCDKKHIIVATSQNALGFRKLQWAGKNILSVADFLNGSPLHPGDHFGSV
jgi:methionyl-tRNA formyltransferase